MKEITADTKKILDKALELKNGSELYFECSTENERDILFSDLNQRRAYLIEELSKYEQLIIEKTPGNMNRNLILKKINISSAYIKKEDGSKEDITF